MPKNIVLLSDGTGNSAAQLLKTNVWRIYESLDLTDPTVQVACYDDGVGTSSFKPLALIGGAFGVGLRRNVLRLYRFLCEHYDPGDRIYCFGFSRGAFTIRVLVGMISQQGIIKTRPTMPVAGATAGPVVQGPTPHAPSGTVAVDATAPSAAHDFPFGAELARLIRWAYRDFRKQFNQTGGLVTLARALRDVTFGGTERLFRHEAYDKSKNHAVQHIEFVGLWDTVDAYGLPVDELTAGVDRWVWPLSMPELKLSPKVKRACHVLALDDERNTFQPVLWDESEEKQNAAHIHDERISQVWFAGMHSNVGGGYPDDALSCVSLSWMAEQAAKQEVRFVQSLIEHHTMKADLFGRLYDSRSGLKAYYRYNPRRIKWLTDAQLHEQRCFGGKWPNVSPTVRVDRPKIHESVFARMAAAPEAYAPIVLPDTYAVVMADGRILDKNDNPYEPVAAAKARAAAQERAWDLVWWKRIAYFGTVAVSFVLVILPFVRAIGDVPPDGGPIGRAIATVGGLLPAYVSPFVDFYKRHTGWFAGLLSILLVLQLASRKVDVSIRTRMRAVWLKVLPPAADRYHSLAKPRSFVFALRSNDWYQGMSAVLRRFVIPNVFGILTLVWIAGAFNRATFETANSFGTLCHGDYEHSRTVDQGVLTALQPFPSNEFCHPTGIRLEAGAKYYFIVKALDDWHDADIPVDSASGFAFWHRGLTAVQRVVFFSDVPFRRVWTSQWFSLFARIGERGIDNYPIGGPKPEFVARSTGELFLFVNDAIAPVNIVNGSIGWTTYYANNRGRATIVVRKVEDAP
jgi:T6SS, Phospholipase effector Tle1-like, catalytic domain